MIDEVERTNDKERLFLMWQSLREAMLKEFRGTDVAPFQIQKADGSVRIVKNLDEFLKESSDATVFE